MYKIIILFTATFLGTVGLSSGASAQFNDGIGKFHTQSCQMMPQQAGCMGYTGPVEKVVPDTHEAPMRRHHMQRGHMHMDHM